MCPRDYHNFISRGSGNSNAEEFFWHYLMKDLKLRNILRGFIISFLHSSWSRKMERKINGGELEETIT